MTAMINKLIPAVGGFAALAAAFAYAAPNLHSSGAGASSTAQRTSPVVVELFQSQGCSDCPPANANLNAIADRPEVVALSFGVTYWDYLGWKDTFATPQNTQRQWDYARYNGRGNVATPQVWINGRVPIVGSDAHQLARAIRAANSNGPPIRLSGNEALVGGGNSPSGGADVWVARYDPRSVEVSIRAGENGGRTLPHKNIVRQLVTIGHWSGRAASFKLPPAKLGLPTAVFLQAGKGGPILSATKSG